MIPIQSITLHKLQMNLKSPFKTSFGTIQNKEFLIIEVKDREGHSGYGETVAFTTPWYTEETTKTVEHMLIDFLIPLVKENPLHHPEDVYDLFSSIRRNNMAKSALEMAIWDLYAKQQEISLSQAIGGRKETIDVGISIGMQPTTEQLIERIKMAIEQGFKRVKLKIGPENDLKLLETVRNYFPNLPLMADANSAYTLEDTDHLKQLDQFNLMMIEQPLAHDDIVDHAKLQEQLETPICLDESIHSFEDVRRAVSLGSCQVINVKAGRVGGLTVAKNIHDFCVKNDIDLWCGGMLEAGIGRAHNIALSSLPGFNLPGDTAGSQHYWHEDIIYPEVTVKKGQISVSKDIGLGYDIHRDTLQRYTVDHKTFHF